MLVSLCESSELVSELLHVCMLYRKRVDVLRVWDMCFGCYSFMSCAVKSLIAIQLTFYNYLATPFFLHSCTKD